MHTYQSDTVIEHAMAQIGATDQLNHKSLLHIIHTDRLNSLNEES